jgi:hypothetical protein
VAKCWGEALYFIYTPPPLVSGRMTNCDKRGGLLSQLVTRPGTKGCFRAGAPKGKFSLFSPGWCYHHR